MAYIKRIVCLANSVKNLGYCVAGREVLENGKYGGWIRPVSARATAEVSSSESRYQDNSSPKLLDVIDVPLLRAAPHNHQTENHIIDISAKWVKKGELPWEQLEELRELPDTLWINSDRTKTGILNCVSEQEALTLNSSLIVIKKKLITIERDTKTWDDKTTYAYRGTFKYKNIDYSLKVTDPVALEVFRKRDQDRSELNDVFLCLSLTEPWSVDNNRCHKLIAGIMSDPSL